jgi:hypothetical protein
MNLKRFEILLPLNYNDGRPIDREKFLLTNRELVQQFGAATVDTTRASGSWMYRGTLYEDLLMRIIVDSPEPDAAEAFLRRYKEVLTAKLS